MNHPHRTVRGWIPIALIGASFLATGSVVFVVGSGSKSSGESEQPPLPTQRTELQRIEARCVEAVRKVQTAVVGVISPSQATRPRPKRHARGASGIIITADGLVLSQMHVSHTRPGFKDFSDPHKPGEEATVLFADGKERKAKLLGASRDYDLSLLQLSESVPYPFVPLQSDVKVRTGDWVVELGHPLGFRKDRPAPVRLGRVLGSNSETFVTDCPWTGGDSGCPFFDLDGRLVGIINTSDESLGSERPQEMLEDTHGHRTSIISAISAPSASYATWRLDDFPIALEYSPPVTTTECGGPLVDLSGRVIGITVGRSESHAGWAIPADEIQRLVVDATTGKLSMWPAR